MYKSKSELRKEEINKVLTENPEEKWKKILFKGSDLYVSSEGRLLTKYGKVKGIKTSTQGYCRFYNTTVHRIVAYAFGLLDTLEFDGDIEVDHINSIRNDNRLVNLQVLTHQQNIDKRDTLGNARNRSIDVYDKNGRYIASFKSIKDAAEELKIASSNICFCLKQVPGHKSVSGYKFKYTDITK